MNIAPISIHLNKDIDRLIVLNSSRHEQDALAKETLVKLGYTVQTMGDIYTIDGPFLDRIKTGLDITYGISKVDRSDEALYKKEED